MEQPFQAVMKLEEKNIFFKKETYFEIHLVFGINHSPHIHDGLTSHPIFQNMLDLTL